MNNLTINVIDEWYEKEGKEVKEKRKCNVCRNEYAPTMFKKNGKPYMLCEPCTVRRKSYVENNEENGSALKRPVGRPRKNKEENKVEDNIVEDNIVEDNIVEEDIIIINDEELAPNEEIKDLKKLYLVKCKRCSKDIKIIQTLEKESQDLAPLLEYIIFKVHVQNTYDSYLEIKNDIKINIDVEPGENNFCI